MANNSNNVVSSSPASGGGFAVAPVGTPLPTSTTSPIPSEFEFLGYLGEDGVTQQEDTETETEKAWGGEEVFVGQTGRSETWTLTLMESENIEVQKLVYGAENVSIVGTGADAQLVVKSNAKPRGEFSALFNTFKNGDRNRPERLVIPRAKIISRDEIKYSSGEAVKYSIEIKALPNEQGDTSYYCRPAPQPVTP